MAKNEDRRTLYSKRVIMQALYELMQDKPLNKITVTEICEKADVNRSTFYAYYDDIYDLYKKILKRYFEKQRVNVKLAAEYLASSDRPGRLNKKDFYNMCLPFFETASEEKDLYRFIYSQNSTNNIHVNTGRNLYKLILPYLYEDGAPSAGKSAFTSAYTFAKGGITAMLIEWLERDCAEPPEKMARHAASYFFGVFMSEADEFDFTVKGKTQ